jgi:tRNA (mo5U34)-methyltransferase
VSTDVAWYHTIDLPSGPTPGEYDLRRSVAKTPFPSRLDGKRCLDVGTHDGFWAFEMERRGGAEVVAIDIRDPAQIDWPEPRPDIDDAMRDAIEQRKQRFYLAHEALRSEVVHRYISVYDLSTAEVGEFDFVHIGSLLQHLRDPVGALMAIRRVARGELLVTATFSIAKTLLYPTVPVAVLSELPGQPFWQVPNLRGLRRMIESAGFEVSRRGPVHLQMRGHATRPAMRRTRLRTWPAEVLYGVGVPHVGFLARPVGR